jgi:hypothetical protein
MGISIMKIKFKFQTIVILSTFIFFQTYCQNIIWYSQIGSNFYDGAEGVFDKNGDFFLAGTFYGSKCYFSTDTLNSIGKNTLLFAK